MTSGANANGRRHLRRPCRELEVMRRPFHSTQATHIGGNAAKYLTTSAILLFLLSATLWPQETSANVGLPSSPPNEAHGGMAWPT